MESFIAVDLLETVAPLFAVINDRVQEAGTAPFVVKVGADVVDVALNAALIDAKEHGLLTLLVDDVSTDELVVDVKNPLDFIALDLFFHGLIPSLRLPALISSPL